MEDKTRWLMYTSMLNMINLLYDLGIDIDPAADANFHDYITRQQEKV